MPLKTGFQSMNCSRGKKENFLNGVSPVFHTLLSCSLSQWKPARPGAANIGEMRKGPPPVLGPALAWLGAGRPARHMRAGDRIPVVRTAPPKLGPRLDILGLLGEKNQQTQQWGWATSLWEEWKMPAWTVEIHNKPNCCRSVATSERTELLGLHFLIWACLLTVTSAGRRGPNTVSQRKQEDGPACRLDRELSDWIIGRKI